MKGHCGTQMWHMAEEVKITAPVTRSIIFIRLFNKDISSVIGQFLALKKLNTGLTKTKFNINVNILVLCYVNLS